MSFIEHSVLWYIYVVWAGFKLRTLWNLYHRDSIAVFKAAGRTIPPNRWVSLRTVFCDIYVVWAGFKLRTLWNLYHRDSIAVFKAAGRTIPPNRWVSLSTVFCDIYVVWAGFKLMTLWNLYHRDSIAVFKAVGRTYRLTGEFHWAQCFVIYMWFEQDLNSERYGISIIETV